MTCVIKGIWRRAQSWQNAGLYFKISPFIRITLPIPRYWFGLLLFRGFWPWTNTENTHWVQTVALAKRGILTCHCSDVYFSIRCADWPRSPKKCRQSQLSWSWGEDVRRHSSLGRAVLTSSTKVCKYACGQASELGISNGSHRNGQLVVSNQRSARAWQSHLTAPRSNLGRSAIESLRFLTNHVDIMTMFQGVGWWHTNCCAAQDKPHSVPMKSGLRGLLSCPGSWWCDFVDR